MPLSRHVYSILSFNWIPSLNIPEHTSTSVLGFFLSKQRCLWPKEPPPIYMRCRNNNLFFPKLLRGLKPPQRPMLRSPCCDKCDLFVMTRHNYMSKGPWLRSKKLMSWLKADHIKTDGLKQKKNNFWFFFCRNVI